MKPLKLLTRIARLLVRLSRLLISDYKRRYLYQYFPVKPVVINFNANDICNSKCVMCNIWQQKRDKEISVAELRTILKDDLFSDVKHVGVTGGEPTLRKDLPELYDVICESLPSLSGVSIITNAIKDKAVIDHLHKIEEVCRQRGVPFSVMVSLDGVSETHDMMRGRKGNFDSAIEVMNYVKQETNLPLSIGCTITRENVWEVDVLLDYLKENDIYGRFRVAEFIKRLYNDDLVSNIRNFDEEESYHLAGFFQKLILTYEQSEEVQRTYRSIISVLTGGPRLIGCPYQTKGVVLDARGDIQYCAPKSQKIGNALSTSANKIYNDSLAERRRILSQDCSDCIHDYHAEVTFTEKMAMYKDAVWRNLLTIDRIGWAKIFWPLLQWQKLKRKKKEVLIVGWYGTETVGDKAILAGIINDYRAKSPDHKFVITSLYPFVTEKTIRELGIDARVIPFYSYQFVLAAGQASDVVMGGGPLMDMEELAIPMWALTLARMNQTNSIIYGCGVGPVKQLRYREAVAKILKRATQIILRDSDSMERAKELSGREDLELGVDPAKNYLKIKATDNKKGSEPIINCFIREWTPEYQGDLSDAEFGQMRSNFETNLAGMIKSLAEKLNAVPRFYPMHTFVVGQDDRDFFRRFTTEHFKDHPFHVYSGNATIDGVVEAMRTASFNLCMRFHSVLFADSLDANYFAIDYTNGGKITGYLKDVGKLSKMKSLMQICESTPDTVTEEVLDQYLEKYNR